MNRTTGMIAAIAAVSLALFAAAGAQTLAGTYGRSAGSNRGWLGVSVQDVTKKLAETKKLNARSGAYVSDVVEDSPAEKAGILEGDVIVKFDGGRIDDRDELIGAVRRADPGDEVPVVVDRKGETKTLTATLDELETPRAMTFTVPVPDVPAVAPMHPRPFGMSFFVSGERLGMGMQTLNRQLAEYFEVPGNRGVLVSSVQKKGAAADAGVKAGDVIVRVNRNSVRDVDDVLDEIREAERDTLPFEVVRRGKPVTLNVGVGKDRGESSDLYERGREEYLDALGEFRGDEMFKEDFGRELRESMLELKRELQEGARELERELGRAFRDS
jgi:S1-C subfamily serine protease